MPTRRFLVPLGPIEALSFAYRFLQTRGYSPDPWNLDSALLAHGDAVTGWKGVVMRSGSDIEEWTADFLMEILPPLLLLPSMRKKHGLVRIAIIARSTSDTSISELFCSFVSVGYEKAWVSPKAQALAAFDSLPQAFAAEGLSVQETLACSALDLDKDHPLHPKKWAALRKIMRQEARQRRR